MRFEILKESKISKARIGRISTPHGDFLTPAFLPVATQGSVKSLNFKEVKEIGFEAILANTFHLHFRPGEKIIKEFGGLHKFIGWPGPIITDSGGFQVFSLGFGLEQGVGKILKTFPGKDISKKRGKNLIKITSREVIYKSPLDGSLHRFTPEKSIKIQEDLGADIIFAFDECTSPLADQKYTKEAMERTHLWAEKCLKTKKRKDQALFGIIQGGEFKNLRKESAKFIASLPFDGFGIGGSLGKSKKDMFSILNWTLPYLPIKKPRHLLGIGYFEDIKNSIKYGIDLFDCVFPTRFARHGVFLSEKEKINILNSKYRRDKKPIFKDCQCYYCQNFSRAYLHHLFKAKEILGIRAATFHNLFATSCFMQKMRKDIKEGRL